MESPIIPVTAAILIHEGKILIAQREEGLSQGGKWEFPGGKVRPDESPEECLCREIKEELGLDIDVGDIFHVVHHRYPNKSILLLAYLCRWNGGKIALREHKACRWVNRYALEHLQFADADIDIVKKLLSKPSLRFF